MNIGGKLFGGVGAVIGGYQAYLALADDDVTQADILNAIGVIA